MRLEGGPEVLHAPALRADAGQQEDRARHQLAHAREALRAGGAGDRAHAGRARTRPGCRAELVHDPGEPLAERRAADLEVLEVGRAGVGGADEHEAAGARAPVERLERVAAEQRVGREGVRSQPGRTPRRRRGRVTGTSPRLPSAITSSPASRAWRHDCVQRRPAVRPEPLEAGELELDRHARRTGGLDRQPAVVGARPPRSGHSAAGSGSSPSTTRLRRSSTSAASRSAKCWLEASAAARS